MEINYLTMLTVVNPCYQHWHGQASSLKREQGARRMLFAS